MKTDEAARIHREQAQLLQQHRKELVLAAEGVIETRFKQSRLTKPKKTQFSNLIGLCNEAQCAEEIANYLRYQAGRNEWEAEFTRAVLAGVQPILDKLPEGARVAAWKLYATYMTRAYVYQDAVTAGGRGHERASR
ncbi:hypothetical protein WMF30_02630 [Sorangium sp. So ce134]